MANENEQNEEKALPAIIVDNDEKWERMAEEYDRLLVIAIDAVNKFGCVQMGEVVSKCPVNKTRFYDLGLHRNILLLEALDNARIDTKLILKRKMLNSESPAAWAMLYKIVGTADERAALNNRPSDNVQAQDIVETKDNFIEALSGHVEETWADYEPTE